MVIRAAALEDHAAIHAVVAAAFEREDEANLVATLRTDGDALLELIAEDGGGIVGHILFSPLQTENGRWLAALAPASVRRARFHQGLMIRRRRTCPRSASDDAI